MAYPGTQLGLIRETCAAMLVQIRLVSGPGDPVLIETRRNRWIESISSTPWQPLHTEALHYPLIVAGLLPQSAGAVLGLAALGRWNYKLLFPGVVL